MRAALVIVHRWAGLVLAGFLLVAGLTGSLLAWNDELEAWAAPTLMLAPPPTPKAVPWDPLILRDRVQAAYPQTFVARAPLQIDAGRALVFRLYALPDPATGRTRELANDQVFVNPYTGALLGERKQGDITQGWRNLMPFVLRLHDSLALGDAGSVLMGVMALLWSLDSIVGALLTLPARRGEARPGRGWLARWSLAWRVRWHGGAHKLNFDLHRAGGLWLWAMLFMLAWSSMAFNLREVYDPVTRALFAYQPDDDGPIEKPAQPLLSPPIAWQQAREIGRAEMAAQARRHGFAVHSEYMLIYDPRDAVYGYYARTDRDVSQRWGITRVGIDGRTGQPLSLWLPTGAAGGDTLRTWITTLHMAATWGLPFQIFVCVTGMVIAMLSVTGLRVWLRKRRARRQVASESVDQGPSEATVGRLNRRPTTARANR